MSGKSRNGFNGRKSRVDNRANNRNNSKGKEFEMNVPDSAINEADLHVKFPRKDKGSNDISWYSNLPQMLKDVASIPFGRPLGTKFSQLDPNDMGDLTHADGTPYSIPGICTIDIAPTLGNTNLPNDAMNLAAQQIYALDRQANSGAKNYDKTDVMMMIAAMDSAYMLYEWILRAYKTLHLYDYTNRYMPDALLVAMGFNPTNLRSEMANFRYLINMYAYKLASINVPDQFDVIHRHSWLFSNIYTDADVTKAQMYIMNPVQLFQYQEGTEGQPSYLKAISITELAGKGVPSANTPPSNLELSDIQTMMDNLINPLLGSEDIGTISGDLAKAFGEGGMIKISPIDENADITPVYNSEVLMQLANATILPVQVGNVTQVLDDLVSGPYLDTAYSPLANAASDWAVRANTIIIPTLNIRSNSPTPELSMIGTRLMASVVLNPEGTDISELYCGTEIVVGSRIFAISDTGVATKWVEFPTGNYALFDYSTYAEIGKTIEPSLAKVLAASKFDWMMPIRVLVNGYGSKPGDTKRYRGEFSDYSNVTLIDTLTLRDLHDVAVNSLFKVKSWK